jgi:hypothetical protein
MFTEHSPFGIVRSGFGERLNGQMFHFRKTSVNLKSEENHKSVVNRGSRFLSREAVWVNPKLFLSQKLNIISPPCIFKAFLHTFFAGKKYVPRWHEAQPGERS